VTAAGEHQEGGFFDSEALSSLLGAFSARTSAPGGGSASALVVALAAGLCAMAARFSDRQLATSVEVAEAADALAARALELAEEDSRAYSAVLAARRLPQGPDGGADRERFIEAAVERAVAVPLEIAETGAEVARLAVQVASEGNPNVRGDALTAEVLAQAATTAARALAQMNLG
jgi:methenyltetrahydrofolate cyclohydrolase